jgi:hypothetical protein
MAAETEPLSQARLLFFGERALTEGYGLIGFETFPDATVEQLDRVLTELLQTTWAAGCCRGSARKAAASW